MEKAGERIGELSLLEVMGRLPDPRSGHGRRHPLGAILGLAICAMLCGSRSLYAISQWGRGPGVGGISGLGLHPGADSLRVHAASGIQPAGPGGLRRTAGAMAGGERAGGWGGPGHRREAIAWDPRRAVAGSPPGGGLRSSVGHRAGATAVAHKRNELEAVYQLLARLDLKGRVVTGDAQFTQREVCQRIVAKGGTTSSQ